MVTRAARIAAWFASKRRVFQAALGVSLLLAAPAWLIVHALADAELEEFQARWAEEAVAARARAAATRLPALRGEAADANAAEAYRAISARTGPRLTFTKKVPTDPAAPMAPRMAELVGAWAQEIAALRSATQAARCDWQTPWEEPAARRGDCMGVVGLARLLIVDGHLRARSGDAPGAAAAWLDAARFSADFERGWQGPLDVLPSALHSLARLVASDRSRELPLQELEQELGRLEAGLVPVGQRFQELRLDLLGRIARAAESGLEAELGLYLRSGAGWLPERLVVIQALTRLDATWREAEVAVERGEVEAWAELDLALRAWKRKKGERPAAIGWNPLVGDYYPTPAEWVDHRRVVLTWLAFVRAAIALERLPAPRDPARVTLPANPFVPGEAVALALEPDGVGYELSVAGPVRLCCDEPRRIAIALSRAKPAAPKE